MTTAPTTDDLDLDLLDDPYKHARCRFYCDPSPRGHPFIALCGRRAIGLTGIEVELKDVPPGVLICPDCLAVYDQPCRLCGRW